MPPKRKRLLWLIGVPVVLLFVLREVDVMPWSLGVQVATSYEHGAEAGAQPAEAGLTGHTWSRSDPERMEYRINVFGSGDESTEYAVRITRMDVDLGIVVPLYKSATCTWEAVVEREGATSSSKRHGEIEFEYWGFCTVAGLREHLESQVRSVVAGSLSV